MSFAQCDVHPARQGHANVKENGKNLFLVDKKRAKAEMPKDHSVAVWKYFLCYYHCPSGINGSHQCYLCSTCRYGFHGITFIGFSLSSLLLLISFYFYLLFHGLEIAFLSCVSLMIPVNVRKACLRI